jgi:phosphatidylglycerol:prolipoprotein diacylglycerol transferase
MAATYWYSRVLNKHYGDVLDFVAPLVPFGLGAGRIGNFIGGELWGRPTDVPWGMVFPHVDSQPRHASQLYEFALEGVLLFCVLWWFSSQPRPRYAVAGLFGLGYGSARFFVEFFREPDAHLEFIAFDWLTMGQLLCLPMIAAGLGLLIFAYRKPVHSPQSN